MLKNIRFIRHSNEYCTFEKHIPAPYFRKPFEISKGFKSVKLTISGLGFYETHINGTDITKGILAPYRSNPEHLIYFDEYDITDYIRVGKNSLGCILGNGMQNALGAYVWKFDEASWRGAPQLAFCIEITYENGKTENICSDETVKTHYSPILFDDLHYGEVYDARLNIDGWDLPEFDASDWKNAEFAPENKGERRICEADPIVKRGELKPVSVTACDDGYIYDFGENNTGLCRLTVKGKSGQRIELRHFEIVKNGKPYYKNIHNRENDLYQEDFYICSGKGTETHIPRFTYHGFRYVCVSGISEEQATKDLLTFVLYSSDIKSRGSFWCDNEVVNKIQEITLRSDISNFHYFPTDCPHREKNGWTGDAAVSAEQLLLNFTPENSYKEWLRSIYKAVGEKGQLPGIVPTACWGYHWGNGPAWDIVMLNLPYFTYKYTGRKDIFDGIAEPLYRYLKYLNTRIDANGLIAIGLGDWCETDTPYGSSFTTPLVITDSITTKDIADKAVFIFDILGLENEKQYAENMSRNMKKAIRKELVDTENLITTHRSQTAQAMAVFYNIFEQNEIPKAVQNLVEIIKENNNLMRCGVLGGRVLFRVLAQHGYEDLALNMITTSEFPSYANWVKRGATTLYESFDREGVAERSLNHHFWGDVSGWFYRYLAGLNINPTARDIYEINIEPKFPKGINGVNASFELPYGELRVEWQRKNNGIELSVSAPDKAHGKIIVSNKNFELKSGKYFVEN